MGILTGLMKGFSEASGEYAKQRSAEQGRQTELEQRIFSTLAGSDDPELQSLAIQGMASSAKGKGKKSFVDAMFGGVEKSPALGDLMARLAGRPGPTSGGVKTTAEMPGGSMVEVPPGGNTPAADVYGGTTTATATPPSPGAGPIFKSGEQRRLEAGKQERADLTGELQGMGVPQEGVLEGVYGVRQQRETYPNYQSVELTLPDGTPAMGTFDPVSGMYIDPSTGRPLEGARPYEKPQAGMTPYQSESLKLQQARLDQARAAAGQGTPRDRPEYLNALATQKSIEAALETEFSEMDRTRPSPSVLPKLQQRRDELAREAGFQNYADVLRNASVRRGEMPLQSEPPAPTQPSVMGDPDADGQRMQEIVLKQRQGQPLTEQDVQFATQYQQTYHGAR